MEALVKNSGLNVGFNTSQGIVYALRKIDLNVRKGKILGVVGGSGTGKSTLVWSVLRLLAANSDVKDGEIIFNDQDVLKFSISQLRDFRSETVSMVFQDPITSQIPVLNYRTQTIDILYRRRHLSRKEKIDASVRIMRKVGIPDASERISQFPPPFRRWDAPANRNRHGAADGSHAAHCG